MDKNKKRRPAPVSRNCAVIITVIGLALLVGCAAVCVFLKPYTIYAIAASVLLFGVLSAVTLSRFASRASAARGAGDVSESVLRNSIQNLKTPLLICEAGTGKIIWYNKSAGELSVSDRLFGSSLKAVFGAETGDVTEDGGRICQTNAGIYRLVGTDITSGDKEYVIVTVDDITDPKKSTGGAARDTAVIYLVADNLEELAEYEREAYRHASAEISSVIREWAGEFDCILKEYEHDKYICVMDADGFEINKTRKFDILDRVRDIRIGEGSVPVTVSVGVSKVGGTLENKDKNARAALEMALQRGGDQAVLKDEDSLEYFGGRTRSVQKRMKVKTRVFANELVTKMSRSSSVIVMGHKFADFDCFGASVGIARLAMFCGVPVHVVTDFDDPSMDDCRDAMMSERDFDGVFVSSDRALDSLDSDVLLVIVDVNNMEKVECPELVSRCRDVIVIDHHRKTAEFEREPLLSYIDPSASATCELVAEMMEQCLPDELLTMREANMMLAGISLDTKQFVMNTGTRTFGAALYLLDKGADTLAVRELFKTSLDVFTREVRFRNNVVIYRGMFAVALADGEGTDSDRIIAAKTADRLLDIEGVKAAFALIKIGSVIHVSARSAGQVNVEIILRGFRGGGHFDSAGAQIREKTMEEALSELKTMIDNYVDEITK